MRKRRRKLKIKNILLFLLLLIIVPTSISITFKLLNKKEEIIIEEPKIKKTNNKSKIYLYKR